MVQPEAEEALPARDVATDFYQRYEVREVLGRGVSSTVRRAVLKATGESFAAKIIDVSEELVDSDGLSLREQTVREVNILRLVAGHDNIIQLVDMFESVTYIFLIFELCVNGELFDHLNSVVTLSEKRARRIMKQVCEAVRHCHRRGVVHRDIKPENILLDQNYNIKLTDFGFAKVLQPRERLHEVCGTPGYLAPELLRAGMVEAAACSGYGQGVDVWACGVVLYTLLAGFPPFWHRKQLMLIRQIMEGRYSFASPEWTSVSDTAKLLISRMLTVEPEERPSIEDCLEHSFFLSNSLSRSTSRQESLDPAHTSELATDLLNTPIFDARRRFRVAVVQVRFLVRLQRLRQTPQPLALRLAATQPYAMKEFRKVIDAAAFRVYGHWVKRGEGQNRAAMFELRPKCELRRQAEVQEVGEVQEQVK